MSNYTQRHPNMTAKQKRWAESTLARGCVGITCLYLNDNEKHDNCYKELSQAKAKAQEMKSSSCCPQIFSVHLWNDIGKNRTSPDVIFNPGSGKADLSNWDKESRGNGFVNFDYGALTSDGKWIIHADQYHNPPTYSPEGEVKGKYYPNLPIREATYYASTIKEWKKSYTDFSVEVWCVQCRGDKVS